MKKLCLPKLALTHLKIVLYITSSQIRARRKLTGKSEWFRKSGDDKQDDQQDGKENQAEKSLERARTLFPTRLDQFVENTTGGKLAKQLRAVEERTSSMVRFRTKIVEGVESKRKHQPIHWCHLQPRRGKSQEGWKGMG